MSGAEVIAENDGRARLGPMRPSGGVDWNRWTHPEKVRLENVTGNYVTYRNRKQWGKGKFVVVSGTEGTLRHTLNKCGPGAEHLRAKLREQFLEMYSNA